MQPKLFSSRPENFSDILSLVFQLPWLKQEHTPNGINYPLSRERSQFNNNLYTDYYSCIIHVITWRILLVRLHDAAGKHIGDLEYVRCPWPRDHDDVTTARFWCRSPARWWETRRQSEPAGQPLPRASRCTGPRACRPRPLQPIAINLHRQNVTAGRGSG